MNGKHLALFFLLLTIFAAAIWFYIERTFEPLTLFLSSLTAVFGFFTASKFSQRVGQLIYVVSFLLFCAALYFALTSQPPIQAEGIEKSCERIPVLFSLTGNAIDDSFFTQLGNPETGLIAVNDASSVTLYAFPESFIDPPRLVASMGGKFEIMVKLSDLQPAFSNAPMQAGIAFSAPGKQTSDEWIQLIQTVSSSGYGIEFGKHAPDMPLPRNVPFSQKDVYLKLIVNNEVRGAFSTDGTNWVLFENAYSLGNISHAEIVLFGYSTGNEILEVVIEGYRIDTCKEEKRNALENNNARWFDVLPTGLFSER